MKSALMAGVVGVFLFVASAGLSWWLIYTPPTPEAEVAQTEPKEFPIDVPEDEKVEQMPVSLRPEAGITMESVTELAESIMKKEKRVFEAEQALKKEEQRIQMLFEDLRREQDELDAVAERIDAMIIEAKEAVKLLQLEKQAITTKTEELSALEKKTGVKGDEVADLDIEARVKAANSVLESVSPEYVSRTIKEIANEGDRKVAAMVLMKLEDHRRRKVVEAMNDPAFVAELLNEFSSIDSGSTKLR